MRAALATCSVRCPRRRGASVSPTIIAPARRAIVSCSGQPAAAVASTTSRMSWVAASGWGTNETCEASHVSLDRNQPDARAWLAWLN